MSLTNGNVETGGYALEEISTEVLIVSGVLTVSSGGLIIVGAESGTTDDLTTINIATGLLNAGYQLTLYLTAAIGDTITIKHNTATILCNTGADISLTENKMAILQRFIGTTNSVVNSKWRCIA